MSCARRPRPKTSRCDVELALRGLPRQRRPRPPPAGRLEPALERGQVHAAGGAVTVVAAGEDAVYTVRVTDTGVGIPAQFLPFAFDRFRQADGSMTREHGGLGLGLAIVKELTGLHGGSVDAHSDGPGRGAMFTLRFPALLQPAPPRPSSFDPAWKSWPASLAGVRVLAVDDNADALDVLSAALVVAGADVRTALSGDAALREWERAPSDMLLCDLAMPDMDGFEVLVRLRQRSGPARPIPAVAISAHATEQYRARSLPTGFSGSSHEAVSRRRSRARGRARACAAAPVTGLAAHDPLGDALTVFITCDSPAPSPALAMLLWCGTLAAAVHGQTATEDLKRMTLEEMMGIEVSTVTRSPERTIAVPAAVHVITQDDMRRVGGALAARGAAAGARHPGGAHRRVALRGRDARLRRPPGAVHAGAHRRPGRVFPALCGHLLGSAEHAARGRRTDRGDPGPRRHALGRQRRQRHH